uniref:Uncharacterized protein n=1 Tax=Arundo donax TaxID=35708 RepID=A0A0A9BK94_ARUDO
MPSSLDCCH